MLPRIALTAAALALLVSGCGGGGGAPAADTPAASTAAATPTTATSQTSPTAPTSSSSPTQSASPSAPASTDTAAPPTIAPIASPTGPTKDLSAASLPAFTDPTGDIGCVFDDGPSVACQAQNAAWKVQKPQSCDGAYGDAVDLARSRASLSCHTDTDFVGSTTTQPPVPYGTTVLYKGMQCVAATTGLTCRNAAGHGFTIARTSYRFF